MTAASLRTLWLHMMCHGEACLDEEGEIKGGPLDGMVAINDVK